MPLSLSSCKYDNPSMALAVDADINQLDSLTFIVSEFFKQEYNRKEDSF